MPRRYETDLGSGWTLEVDVKKDDCNREPPHCHLCYRGRRYGQIWLDGCVFEKLPGDVPNNIINLALSRVAECGDEMEEVYNYNRMYGAG